MTPSFALPAGWTSEEDEAVAIASGAMLLVESMMTDELEVDGTDSSSHVKTCSSARPTPRVLSLTVPTVKTSESMSIGSKDTVVAEPSLFSSPTSVVVPSDHSKVPLVT